MPELPEVETVRRGLENHLQGDSISKITIRTLHKNLGLSAEDIKWLLGKKLTSLERRGKLMIWNWDDESKVIHAHLKMTGQFIVTEKGKTLTGTVPELYRSTSAGEKNAGAFTKDQDKGIAEDRHTHLEIMWESGKVSYFRDVRKFGYIKLIEKEEHEKILNNYGPDALNDTIDQDTLERLTQRRKKPLKSFLLDQKCIAGIGNIYADEICFLSGIHPLRKVNCLSDQELKTIATSIKSIIKQATENKGTTLSDYRDADGKKGSHALYLQVYGRETEACTRCDKSSISKLQVLGRGTHFCQNCQA